MNIKRVIGNLTGYWLHKKSTLPIGADLFYDICERLQFGELKTVFDVGANTGQTVRWIRHHQPNARVHSFEPVSVVFAELQKTIAEVGGDCVAEQIAFGEEKGEKEIRLFEEMSVLNSLRDDLMSKDAEAKKEVIRIDTIDDYCAKSNIERIDLLKIDTEGFELPVLRGAARMLTGDKIAFVYCECGFTSQNTRNTGLTDLCQFMESKGFFLYGLYQVSDHNWHQGMHFGNALFANVSMVQKTNQ